MSVEVTLPEGSSGVLQSLRAEPPERTTAVCLYELAVILPLLAWLGWSFTRAPAEVSDPLRHPNYQVNRTVICANRE